MRSFASKFGFPLLTRELVELAAARRTYVLRSVYATVFFALTLWTYWNWLARFRPDSFDLLGQGKTLFRELIHWQFRGIYLFLPLMTAGAITAEKEQDTLSILLLTKLGGWTILLEKLLSRLVAMGTFLLLALPLAAVAYSLGGVDVESILKAAYVLCLTAWQVASFSLLCSTWFRTTSSAFIGTYLIGTIGVLFGSALLKFVLGAGIALNLHQLPWPGLDDEGRDWFVTSISNSASYRPFYGPWLLQSDPIGVGYVASMLGLSQGSNAVQMDARQIPLFSGPGVLPSTSGDYGPRRRRRYRSMSRARAVTGPATIMISGSLFGTQTAVDLITFKECVACSIPLIGSSLVFLLLARILLWRRLFVPETNLPSRMFALCDRLFQWLNRNPFTRGIAWHSRQTDLPGECPIAWRESRKRSLGTTRYLIRLLLLLEVPLLAWIARRLSMWNGVASLDVLADAFAPLWILAILVVAVQSTGLIAIEKSRQTLDVLLVTPLSSRDIALQKMTGLRRLMRVLAVPLITVILSMAAIPLLTTNSARLPGGYYRISGNDPGVSVEELLQFTIAPQEDAGRSPIHEHIPGLILAAQILGLVVYLPLFGWIGFQFGLRLRTQLQAFAATLLAIGLMFYGPALVVYVVKNLPVIRSLRVTANSVTGPPHLVSPGPLPFVLNDVTGHISIIEDDSWKADLLWLSPARVLFPRTSMVASAPTRSERSLYYALACHFVLYLIGLVLIRRNALRQFGRLVGRCEAPSKRMWRHRPTAAEVTGPDPTLDPQRQGNRSPWSSTPERD